MWFSSDSQVIHKWFTGYSEKINIFLAAGESDVDADLDADPDTDVVFKDPAMVMLEILKLRKVKKCDFDLWKY